jgi:serine/threonine protein kinase
MPRRDDHLPETLGIHYRVVSRIGLGGMGVVYKAVDARLNRAVAIKVIHDTRLSDAGDRLRTEALALASIDHPYICKVYEVFEDRGDVYLVMEFVEGETLASILRRGKPPLGQIVEIASEIVEGLAEAHSRGFVHRDVKPSNVMITKSGHVKLLDFGLAREDVAATPTEHTRTSPSERSAYAGTPQYMAPEQAAGNPVTARADLFSVGVIIFECLTGRLPFAGSSPYDYVRHLLADDPRPLDRLAPEAPADLVRLVQRCLEKVPADRPATAFGILDELRKISGSLSAPGFAFNSAGAERSKRRWQLVAAASALAAITLVAWFAVRNRVPEQPLRQSRPVVTWPSEEKDSRLSPDGRWLSFLSTRSGSQQLFVQPIDGTEPRHITLSTGVPLTHVWSPDGKEIAALIMQGQAAVLQIVPAFFGGAARLSVPLETLPSQARLLRWIDDTVFIEISDRTGVSLFRIDLARSVAENVSASWRLQGELRYVDVHPDGRRVVISVQTRDENLWTGTLDGSSWKPISRDPFFARYPMWNPASGTLVYQSNRGGQIDLWEMDLESGRSWSLTSSQTEEIPTAVSADGQTIVFTQLAEEARLWLWNLDTGTSRPITADALSDLAPSLSADGRFVAFQRTQPSPSRGYQILDSRLLIADLSSSGLIEDPRTIADGFAGVLSPDGAAIAFLQRGTAPGLTKLQVRNLKTDETTQVSTSIRLPILANRPMPEWAERPAAWSGTGDEVYFVEQSEGARQSIRSFRVGSREARAALVTGEPGEWFRDLHVSASGEQLVYLAYRAGDRETGAFALRQRSLTSHSDRVWIRLEGTLQSVFGHGWLRDGSFVLTRSTVTHDDTSSTVEIILATPDGRALTTATVTNGFPGTSRLDAARGRLTITRVDNGVHNIYSVPVAGGDPVRISDNIMQGVTYAGALAVGANHLLSASDERRLDIWLIEARPVTTDASARRRP